MSPSAVFLLLILILSSLAVQAQQSCPQAPVLAPSKEANFFSAEQEMMLGDIVAQNIALSLKIIEDERVAGFVQRIGDRLVEQFPSSGLRFQFFVIDAPEANAFALPGGRIYVTRKLIATTRSEDELAGVLAHEMGHQVTHQSAIEMTRLFREVLGFTQVGDRADIEDKYHRFLDNYARKPALLRGADRGERRQINADQVAVYSLGRAGYRPQAIVDFWDRFAETKGKKGSWLSDFFGSTKPESKRLREFVKNLGAIPAGCVDTSKRGPQEEFPNWQTAVKAYSGFGKKESLHNVALHRTLNPWLRGDIRHFRFSPDGKYILAQDDASIFVLSRDPLASLFRINAEDAYPAQFSPDSKYIVFHNEGLRIEKWSIAEQQQQDVREIHLFRGCLQSDLSPDGSVLACLQPEPTYYFPLELSLFDVATGEPVLTKKSFIGPAEVSYWSLLLIFIVQSARGHVISMAFSPDGHYFLAGSTNARFAFDLTTRKEFSLPGSVSRIMSRSFAFVGPDQLVGVRGNIGEHSAVVRIPSGEVVTSEIVLGPRALAPAAHGDYVIVRPLQKAPVGIMDLKAKRIFMGSKTDALDIYDGTFVGERVNGEVGLYTMPGQPPLATVRLPRGPLSSLRAAAVSPDLRLLAISERTRGAVWDLDSGERLLYVRGFRGVHLDGGALYMDFAPVDDFSVPLKGQSDKELWQQEQERPGDTIARLDLADGSAAEVAKFQKKTMVHQYGPYLLAVNHMKDDQRENKNMSLEARDLRTGAILWSRRFPKEMPGLHGARGSGLLVFTWDLESGAAKDEIKADPRLKELVAPIKESEGSYLVEVVDLSTGKTVGKFPVETGKGSFHLRRAGAYGDRVVFVDSNSRLLIYSLKGERKGRLFGRQATLAKSGDVICLEREPGRLALYDLASLHKRDEFTFPSPLSYASFSDDGKRLLVLTDDQNVYVLDMGKAGSDLARN